MTTTINVNPKQDFWHRLCRTGPLRAVSELVWNSFDADAENVSVEFRLNPLEGVEELGGGVIMSPMSIGMGTIAVVRDPQGGVFALFAGDMDP